MNYNKIYEKIVEKRKLEEPKDCYTEVHHILPASLGGSNDKDNLVRLTAREHFICHALLLKIQPIGTPSYYKMLRAFMMMSCCSGPNQKRYTGRVYSKLKEEWRNLQSYNARNNNHMSGKCWCVNVASPMERKVFKLDSIPDGWITAKDYKVLYRRKKCKYCDEQIPLNKKVCNNCKNTGYKEHKGNKTSKNNAQQKALNLYKIYIDNQFESLTDFCNSEYYNRTIGALYSLWSRAIPEEFMNLKSVNYNSKFLDGSSSNGKTQAFEV